MLEPQCDNCPLGNEPKVKGMGTTTEGTKLLVTTEERTFDLVIIGMAPATEEMYEKRPMVGPSGRFLRKTLFNLNIKDYYITNCFMCPIPEGCDSATLLKAHQCCTGRLLDDIKQKQPKLIIALGDMPFHLLCDSEDGVMESQGRLFESKIGIPTIPIAHPAYYLRRPDDAYDFIESTRVAVRYLSNNYHRIEEVTRTIVTDDNIESIIQELNKHEILTIDTETSGLDMLGIHPDRLLELGISYNHTHCYIIEGNNTTCLQKIKPLLETKKINGWNLFFDARVLKTVGININIWFDGMLAHYCLDERQTSHGLKKVARVYLGADNWEKDIHDYLPNKNASYELIPKDVRQTYLSKDVCYTHQMYDMLSQEVQDHWVFHNILIPATRVFSETMYRGIKIDPGVLLNLNNTLKADVEKDEQELWAMVGKPFNPNSSQQVASILYEDLGIPIDPREGRTTNKKILERYRYQYEFVDRLILHREMKHDISQYVEGFAKRIDNDFRIHPSIKMFGAVTGRISSTDPSIMNIKRESSIKNLFVAEPRRLIAEFDLSGAELRWYCIYAEDTVLKDVIEKGFQGNLGFTLSEKQKRDPHYIIGAIAYGKEKADELRVASKMTVFGRIYLRGLESIERQYGRDTARRLMEVMDELIPNHKKYTSETRKKVRNQGYVESIFGRKRRFPLITKDNESEVDRQAVNMPIQSASSDLNLLNLIYLYENRHQWDIMPLFTVHDSIIVDIPDASVVGPIKKVLEDNTDKIVNSRIKFTYDAKYGPSWGEAEKYE